MARSDGGGGRCLMTGTGIPFPHIREEGKAGRMGKRLMAVVAESSSGRVYLSPMQDQSEIALSAVPKDRPLESISHWPGRTNVVEYGLTAWGDLFTDRQLVALTMFSDLVSEARERALEDALATGMNADALRLADGGTGAQAYGDAVATYLGLGVSKTSNICSTITSWMNDRGALRETFARQAIPMVWDFAESNPFSNSGGSVGTILDKICRFVGATADRDSKVHIFQHNAEHKIGHLNGAIIGDRPTVLRQYRLRRSLGFFLCLATSHAAWRVARSVPSGAGAKGRGTRGDALSSRRQGCR